MGAKKRNFKFTNSRSGAAITVRITPRARQNEVYEILDDGTIKVRLKASSPDAKINQELLSYLSAILEVPQERLEIVAGDTGMDKLVTITDIDAKQVQRRILSKMNLDTA